MIKNLFRTGSQYQSLINQINILENVLKTFSDNELRAKSFKLKKQLKDNKNLNAFIAESFALTREASLRTLGLRHFDVQLMGGLVLNQQNIAEIKTGEGKTLVATLPAFLNALTNKGVHIVTVNDYLANRDQVSMGQIYRFLGLSTGLIQAGMASSDRRQAYNADITYVTNSELPFDYLRDHMAKSLKEVVLRPFNYCIVDEVDSILIDEAQTPLVISTGVYSPTDKYIISNSILSYLRVNIDYKVNEKDKNIILTGEGTIRLQTLLKVNGLYNKEDPWITYIVNAIKAKFLYDKNIDYIIDKDRILIVDKFTGRIMPDRRWGEGLHQAVEAKENVLIRKRTEIGASISYQNFFLLYPKLTGMTGTAKTSKIEFENIYNLSVKQIPTANPVIRKDFPDAIYKDQLSKWSAVSDFCSKIIFKGQPILIGTPSVEKSEMLAEFLNQYKLNYSILNARSENVRRESEIIAQAGSRGRLTIATNMAGRGTDIILGGDIKSKLTKNLYLVLAFLRNNIMAGSLEFPSLTYFPAFSQKSLSIVLSILNDPTFLKLSDTSLLKILKENYRIAVPKASYQHSIKFLLKKSLAHGNKKQEQKKQVIKNLGGLYIIGTQKNESMRIDEQLRGRSGRQGDPGKSKFFLSIDDTLFRFFGGEELKKFVQTQQMLDGKPLENQLIQKISEIAQFRIEERAYQGRKNLFDYEIIKERQQRIFYSEREQVLRSVSIKKKMLVYGEQIIVELLKEVEDKLLPLIENLIGSNLELEYDCNYDLYDFSSSKVTTEFTLYELQIYLFSEFWLTYETIMTAISIYHYGIMEHSQKLSLLFYTDQIWRDQMMHLLLLRDSVRWRTYSGISALSEYKKDAFGLFETKNRALKHLIVYHILRISLNRMLVLDI